MRAGKAGGCGALSQGDGWGFLSLPLQFAKIGGKQFVIGTSSSDEKLQRREDDGTRCRSQTIDSLPNGRNGYSRKTNNRGAIFDCRSGAEPATFTQIFASVAFMVARSRKLEC